MNHANHAESRRRRVSIALSLLLVTAGACSGSSDSAIPDPGTIQPTTDSDVPVDGAVTPVDSGTIPEGSSEGVVPNLDSAIINIEPVSGAADYRAFRVDGAELTLDSAGRESVKGATIFCAGLRQHAAPAHPPAVVVPRIEVTGLAGESEFIVEAIDHLCPFPGIFGKSDTTIAIASPDAPDDLKKPVPIVSEASIRARYGSMIFNGQGAAAIPGQPAEPLPPKVIKQWKVKIAPLDATTAAARKTATFFADFSENDQPTWVAGGTNPDGTFHQPDGYGYSYGIYQNKQFAFYTTNTELIDRGHVFIDRGVLQTILPDLGQDVMSTVQVIPKKPAHLFDTGYLHVTFEGTTNSTNRRYWWLSLCGAETPGKTFAADGLLTSHLSLDSGFFDADGMNPSTAGWNCFVAFPHDGLGTHVPVTGSTNPESSLLVMIHKAGAPKNETAVNVSPQQVNDGYPAAWYRLMHGGAVTEQGMFDDLLQNAPRARFDFFISRTRAVMYVEGKQRLCNDFGAQKLTMAEAAVGFNTALYHSSAEHSEMKLDFADRTGQTYYLQDTVFAEPHAWDNLGFEENVTLPSSFDSADCYAYAP